MGAGVYWQAAILKNIFGKAAIKKNIVRKTEIKIDNGNCEQYCRQNGNQDDNRPGRFKSHSYIVFIPDIFMKLLNTFRLYL